MKNLKGLIVILVMSLFLGGICRTAEAATIFYSEKPTTGVAAVDLSHGSSFESEEHKASNSGGLNSSSAVEDSAYIAYWGCDISNTSSGVVRGFGQTVANRSVESLNYVMYLQEWDGYKWVDKINASNYNSSNISVEGNHYFSVTKGKYYRLFTYHSISDSGYSDFETSTSPYISVN